MAKVAGKGLKIYTGATPVAIDCLTDASLELSAETIDVSCKDNATGYGGFLPGIKTGSLSGTAFLIDDGTNSLEELFTAFDAGTEIDWKFSNELVGTSFKSGKGYFTALSEQGGVNDAVQFSFTISISSAVTQTAVV